MEAFLGKWQTDKESVDAKEFEDVMKYYGADEDTTKKCKKGDSFETFAKDGDSYKLSNEQEGMPEFNQTYTFKVGEEMVSKDAYGKEFKFLLTIEDGKMVEKVTYSDGRTFGADRIVNGGEMKVEGFAGPHKMKYKMNKK